MENGYGIHESPVFECEKGFKYGNRMKEVTSRCILLPMFLGGRRIDVLTYVIQGAAPILVGRPLLEKLGLTVDYNKQLMRWPNQNWETAPRGLKGEYILHLGRDLPACRQREPDMVLMPEDFDDHIGQQVPIQTFLKESAEDVMTAADIADKEMSQHHDDAKQCNTHPAEDGMDHETEEPYGRVMRLQHHVLRKMETNLKLKAQNLGKILYASKSLDKSTHKPHVIWEVFVGACRTSHYLTKYDNVLVEVFSLCTGWDFNFEKAADRKRFLSRLREEQPDDVLMAPMCRLWSPLQELTCANTAEHLSSTWMERANAPRRLCLKLPSTALARSTT